MVIKTGLEENLHVNCKRVSVGFTINYTQSPEPPFFRSANYLEISRSTRCQVLVTLRQGIMKHDPLLIKITCIVK